VAAAHPGGDPWLFAICLSRVGAYMVYIAYAAAMPVLQREWQMSATAAGSIASSFQLAYALSLMGCSELADRLGARRMFVTGTLASAVAAAVFALFARDYWSGLVLYTMLAVALGGTYTTGILLLAENVPVASRGRAMGFFLGGHSLGLAVALVLRGIAVPLGGYPLAFALVCLGPLVGGVVVGMVLRDTPNRVTERVAGERFDGAVLKNGPAMLVIAGYTCHSWELLGMWAWAPAFMAACFIATGSERTRAAGLGSYMTSLFHLTGILASVAAGLLADRLGRTPVILAMASLSMLCSFVFGWLFGSPVWIVAAVGLVYGFTALGDSPIYSTAITEVVPPAYRGAALALRSLAGYGAGAAAPLVFGALLDLHGGMQAGRLGWGWAFASLAVAGAGAVMAATWLHLLPAARALTIGHQCLVSEKGEQRR
jgi:MFS family permease